MNAPLELAAGERVIWSGRPRKGLHFRAIEGQHFFPVMVMAAIVVAVYFGAIDLADMDTPLGPFLLFCTFAFGVSVMIWEPYLLIRSRYYLTKDRAYIVTSPLPLWTRTKSYPLSAFTILDYQPGPLATIWFHTEVRETQDGERTVRAGFRFIEEGALIHQIMRDIQRKKTNAQP